MIDPDAERLGDVIVDRLRRHRKTPETAFRDLIRQSLDEVIDGPRTQRWEVGQLESTEKTYIGTKIEILVRAELRANRGTSLDCQIDDLEFDVKWSLTGKWMIGPENVDKLCLGVATLESGRVFSVGTFRATQATLSPGRNRDKKAQLSAEAWRGNVRWLVQGAHLPDTFIAKLDPETRKHIFAGSSAQERVRLLANLVRGVPIPREAFETVAGNKHDPMRRLRQDKLKGAPLGEVTLLSTKYGKQILASLGFDDLPKDHWIAVPTSELSGRGE